MIDGIRNSEYYSIYLSAAEQHYRRSYKRTYICTDVEKKSFLLLLQQTEPNVKQHDGRHGSSFEQSHSPKPIAHSYCSLFIVLQSLIKTMNNSRDNNDKNEDTKRAAKDTESEGNEQLIAERAALSRRRTKQRKRGEGSRYIVDEEDPDAQLLNPSRTTIKTSDIANQSKVDEKKSKTISPLVLAPGNEEDEKPSWHNHRNEEDSSYSGGSDDNADEKATEAIGAVPVPGSRGMADTTDNDDTSIDVGDAGNTRTEANTINDLPILEGEVVSNDVLEGKVVSGEEGLRENELLQANRQKRILMLASIWMLVALILVIVLVVVLRDQSTDSPTPAPSSAPTKSPAPSLHPTSHSTLSPSTTPSVEPSVSQYGTIQLILQRYFNGTLPSSVVQQAALEWLANEDSLSFSLQAEPDILLERFVLFVFYHSTKGDTWSTSINWVSSISTCGWEGITCSEDGRIVSINLGT